MLGADKDAVSGECNGNTCNRSALSSMLSFVWALECGSWSEEALDVIAGSSIYSGAASEVSQASRETQVPRVGDRD
jgi:hypothetical protein